MPFLPLSAVLVLALSLGHAEAQVADSAPACVRNCARVKVSEGYCSQPTVLAAAFSQCLTENCNAADASAGLAFTNSVCTGANATNTTGTPAANGTIAPLPNGVPAPLNGTNGTATGNSSDYAAAVDSALRGAGLTTLATVLATPSGAALVSRLQNGNFTLFAPTDAGLSSFPVNSTSAEDLTAILEYHVVPGSLDASQLPPTGNGIVRTALQGTPYVSLPANDSQVVVVSRDANQSVQIIEPTRNITASNFTRVGNLELSTISNVLTVPGTIGAVAAGLPQISTLVGLLNSSAPQIFTQLDQTPGLTIFAPINSALNNTAQGANFQGILLNHIVNGSVLYSTVIANTSSVQSAGGASIQFSANGTGVTATSGNKTFRIVQSDIITRTGVIHLVDGLFDPSNSTATFPLVNTNNASETIGIVPVNGSNATNTAQSAASNSATWKLSPSSAFFCGGVMSILGAVLL